MIYLRSSNLSYISITEATPLLLRALTKDDLFAPTTAAAGLPSGARLTVVVDVPADGRSDLLSLGDTKGALALGSADGFLPTVPVAYKRGADPASATVDSENLLVARAGLAGADDIRFIEPSAAGMQVGRIKESFSGPGSGYFIQLPYPMESVTAWPPALADVPHTSATLRAAPVMALDHDDVLVVTPTLLAVLPTTVSNFGQFFIDSASAVLTPRTPPGVDGEVYFLHDVTADKRADFVTVEPVRIAARTAQASGAFGPERVNLLDEGRLVPFATHFSDLNNDGRLDLVYAVTDAAGSPARLLHARLALAEPPPPPAGLFGPARRVPIEIGDGWDGAWTLADLDGDKTPDLVHLGTVPGAPSVGPGRQVFLKRGLGDGAFGRTELWSTPNSVPPLQALDELVAIPVTSTTREDILIGYGQGSSFSLLRFR